MSIRERIGEIPDRPGTYLIKDADGNVLYVGKARSLRKRLGTWFGDRPKHSAWADVMMRQAADCDYVVTGSELEAVILESNLIKEHNPRYNIKLTDGKNYPYLKLTLEEPYPRLVVVRELPKGSRANRPGSRAFTDPKKREVYGLTEGRYFGPFGSAAAMWRTIRIVNGLFGLRSCKKKIVPGKRAGAPCLNYHMGRCMGPCTGEVSVEEYRSVLPDVIMFLEGRQTEILKGLREDMRAASESLDFERAARLRDKITAIERVVERQNVVVNKPRDEDVLAVALANGRACVQALTVRAGKLIDQDVFMLGNAAGHTAAEVLEGFMKQFYADAGSLPREVLVSEELEDAQVLAEWLTSRRGSRVRVFAPQRGEKRRLVQMALQNAASALERKMQTEHERRRRAEEAMAAVVEALGLSDVPRRIEAYDISNTSGREAVGSMVVFRDGQPSKSDYRRFKMRFTEGSPDDYAMIREMLARRCARARDGDEKFATLPDLILVDGGKGQLNAALEVLEESGMSGVEVVGLAKQFEEFHRPGQKDPIVLPDDSPAKHLLQRVRDEAHRFARTYHTGLRDRRATDSLLDHVPGIGPKRRQRLLSHFRSMAALREASVEELSQVPGMTRSAAQALREHLDAQRGES